MSPTVQYFFAFSSPYAGLADARIDDLVAKAGAELEPIPVVAPPSDPPEGLAATLLEFKRSYMFEDVRRFAEEAGIPWAFPERDGPVDGVDATAGWYFASEHGRERGYRNAVFRAHCSEGRDIADPEVLADCAESAGLDRADFLAALRARRYHDEVPKTLALCLEAQVFGVPLFVVNGKRFWGQDRVAHLLEELGRSG